ncbi:hypothetical protein TGGT1_269582 [Toxoplasma gondii GT1]|uniref:14-3-3 domain protein n=7 Tax=Toxoplasma gondii TaxID=5811 RepID=A0A125YYS9_TOXGV|nr:hypothetical protein TGGT1_269582 [Toxoplasma gondii GT1]ESS36409.1 putative 14-3-3 domain protein [Toxoplasma gondii VEG]
MGSAPAARNRQQRSGLFRLYLFKQRTSRLRVSILKTAPVTSRLERQAREGNSRQISKHQEPEIDFTMAREENLYMARLAEETERYEDLVHFMRKVVESGQELNDEERNLLSVGYKNIVGGFRSSWRSLALIEQRDLDAGSLRLDLLTNYRRRLELQLEATCDEVTQLIDKHLLPTATSTDCKAFYLKMKADYCRYMSEVAQDEKFRTVVETAHRAYEEAYALAEAELPECHPVRLGIALNYSVFYYEALIEPDKACELARAAIDASSAVVNTLEEEQAQDTLAMMQLLQDNLELWTTETLEEGGPPEDAVEEQL